MGYNKGMLFAELAQEFERIERENLRNKKTEILAEILKRAEIVEVDKLVYLAIGGLRPEFDRLEFNLAEKMILRAMGTTLEEYKKVGDLGEVAMIKSQKFRSSPDVSQRSELGVSEVYEELVGIARESGTGSQERKVTRLNKLIGGMDGLSAKYVVRMVAGKLRLGFSDKTVLDALSYLENGTKDYSEMLESAYQRCPDVGVLARQVKVVGVVKAVEAVQVTLGTPIIPALAQRLKTAKEMIEKMGRVYVETKWDGSRVQIHYSANQQFGESVNQRIQSGLFEEEKSKIWVKSFTRNLDESSAQFPELLHIGEQIKADNVILDSEAVGYDPKTGENVPFQVTITRKRKHGVAEASSVVPLKFYVFDIMYLNGESLIHLPLRERKKILNETIQSSEPCREVEKQGSELCSNDVLVVGDYIETESPDELREYHRRQLAAGFEGAVVKQVEGEYMPGRTGFNWVKFKEAEDSRAKLSDTIDAIIMGYNKGKGKRSGFGIGAFLIGVNSGEKIVTIAKVGTGISDELFGQLFQKLERIRIDKKPDEYQVEKNLEPDFWVEPKIAVEVAADEITISPSHSAGCALRFPRLIKIREDKGINEITTLTEIEEMQREC